LPSQEVKPKLFLRKASGLVREVGPITAIAYVMSYAIGGGVHRLYYFAAYWWPGANVIISSLIVALASFVLFIVYAFMLAAMPRTGGDYLYVSRIINPFLGFLSSWGWFVGAQMCIGFLAWLAVDSFGAVFSIYGALTGNMGVSSIGSTLGFNYPIKAGVTAAIVIFFGITTLLGLRVHKYMIQLFWIIPLLAAIPMFASFIMNTPQTVQVGWDNLFGAGVYNKIIELAHRTGFNDAKFTTFDLTATLNAASVPIWTWVGVYSCLPIIGGEIKGVKKKFFGLTMVCWVIIAAYYTLLPYFTFNAYGPLFTTQYIWVYKNAYTDLSAIIPHPPPPTAGLFAAPLLPGPLALFVAAAIPFWMLNYVPAAYLICSRLIFGWSFDRFFPEKFGDVSEKWHSPHWAVLLTIVLGVVSIYPTAAVELGLWGANVGALDQTPIWWFSTIPVCWAAIILPYTRKDIYESGLKAEIFGVPIITIAGLIGSFVTFWLWWISILAVPAWPDAFMLCALMFIGAIIYWIYYVLNTRRGIDVATIYAQVPPT